MQRILYTSLYVGEYIESLHKNLDYMYVSYVCQQWIKTGAK